MNKLTIKKLGGEYFVICDEQVSYSAVAIQAVIDWLKENFAPPISVRWLVDARSKTEIKEKYSY